MAGSLKRRDLLRLLAGAAGVAAAVKVGGRALLGPTAPPRAVALDWLDGRQEGVVRAVAEVIAGEEAAAALADGSWDPATDMDRLLGGLAPDQARLAGIALHLLEEWTFGLRGFSARPPTERLEVLESWRTSANALQRSVWGLLHAACASSWSSNAGGHAVMGYPGPCLGRRSPGQSALFVWDETVP